jgi:hypothetical protein
MVSQPNGKLIQSPSDGTRENALEKVVVMLSTQTILQIAEPMIEMVHTINCLKTVRSLRQLL